MDEAGNPVRATNIVTSKVESKVALRSGDAIPVQGVLTRSKSGTAQIMVVVAARLLEEVNSKE